MAMKIKNLSNKIIGVGDITVLPGKTETVPVGYETNPVLAVYKKCGIAEISGKPSASEKSAEQKAAEKAEAEAKAAEEAENLRNARLASLEGASEEDVARLANELGINPAECKDGADVLKKVKAALKK